MEQPPGSGPPLSRFVAAMASSDLHSLYDEATQADIEAEMELVHLSAGSILFRRGDAGDSMYVLTRGRLGVRIEHGDGGEPMESELAPGAMVGEMALLTDHPRVVTVRALEDAELMRLSRAGFDRLAEKHPQTMHELARAILPRLQLAQLAGVLTDLFGPLDTVVLHDLQAELTWVHLPGGTTLFRQGEPGDAMYIVVNGCLRVVVKHQDGTERMVGEALRGASVGEWALLTGEPRSATVYATRDTYVVKLPQDDFVRVLERYPRAVMQIARTAVNRARLAIQSPGPGTAAATNFALVPAGDGAPLTAVARRLVEALESHGPVLHVSSERFDSLMGRAGAAQTPEGQPLDVAILGWLTEQERLHKYVVYESDHTWSYWTQRCVRQADRLLVVGRGGGDPTVAALEAAIWDMGTQVHTELVLVQPASGGPTTGTHRWLGHRQVHTHHHVRLDSHEDFRRMARRLTGRAVGLVLSGGGARGFAHIGAIQALREAELEVDLVGGTSMGALVGALIAMDADYPRLVELANRFSSRRQLLDPTLPLVSFFAARKLTSVYRTLFADARIEDLRRPFFCISTNLTQALPVVHQDGPVWRSVRASTAIPGIFAPVLQDGDVLVDGGVMNHFPLDEMRDNYECGLVVGVNATPFRKHGEMRGFGPSLSGWEVLWSRINPAARDIQVPSLFATLMRMTEAGTAYRIRSQSFRSLADVLIEPPLERFGILDFDRYPEIIEAGYRAAREQIDAWRSEQPSTATR